MTYDYPHSRITGIHFFLSTVSDIDAMALSHPNRVLLWSQILYLTFTSTISFNKKIACSKKRSEVEGRLAAIFRLSSGLNRDPL